MRFGEIEDLLRSAALYKGFKHGAAAGITDIGGKLSVGKHAGAAFAELHVAL